MFDIKDFSDKLEIIQETSAFVEAYCPVCHSPNFKYNTRTSAYKCWMNFCSSQNIKEKLGYSKTFSSDSFSNEQNRFSKSKVFTSQKLKPLPVFPIEFPSQVSLLFAKNFVHPKVSSYFSKKYSCQVTEAEYSFDASRKVVRIDFLENNEKRKIFAPKYWNGQEWKFGSGDTSLWTLLNESFISGEGFLLMAEGEKTAVSLCSLGFLCTTPPAFGFNQDWLTNTFLRIANKTSAKGFVYFVDNDEPGFKKGKLVQESAWSVGYPCKLLSVSTLWNVPPQGCDAADAIQEFGATIVKNFIYENINN